MTLADTNASLYQTDFYAWTTESARLLRDGRYSEIDLISLAEEVESMGANTRQQLVNRLRILLAHLLKWQYQPHFRSRSWQATIKEQRFSIADLLEENPSLTSVLPERIAKAYRLAVLLAVRKTNLPETTFPSSCPYSTNQIISIDDMEMPDWT